MKEVVTLSEILDAVNRKEISQVLDVLCQRILAIQAAKTKGGDLGKGGIHRTCGQPQVLGQQQYAGADKSVRRRFRRSWFAMGGATVDQMGFMDFYSLVGRVRVKTLHTCGLSMELATEVHHLFSILGRPSCMAEFKTGRPTMTGHPRCSLFLP